jgi:hypothetical protein
MEIELPVFELTRNRKLTHIPERELAILAISPAEKAPDAAISEQDKS